ncbi:MAG: hypothetical protein GC160_14005 [Acidobacteria bacterium]|nr:hypothetical protein [Acidobacteriota bacterium]
MKMTPQRWLAAIAIGVAVGFLVYFMFPLIVVSAVSATVASLVTIGVYRYLDSNKKPEAPPKADPRKQLRELFDGLVSLNILVREEGLHTAVLARVEGIIDKLRALLPEINERYPSHELTWTLNQMAKEYLPKAMRPYVALGRQDREDRRAELLKSLDGLEAEIDNVAELVRGDKMGDFKAKAAFLRARFVQGL